MACNPISAVTYTCLQSSGGVQKIYVTNYTNMTATTFNSINTITGITLSGGSKFQEFQFNPNTSSLAEQATINEETGSSFITQNVSLVIPRRESAKRDKILVLFNGQQPCLVLVKDMNAEYYLVGYANGARLSELNSGTGLKKDEGNNYSLVIKAEEPTLAYHIDSSIISGLL